VQQRHPLGGFARHLEPTLDRRAGRVTDRDRHVPERTGRVRTRAGRDDQHGHARAGDDPLAHGADAQPRQSAALVAADDDHVRIDRQSVQQDDLRGIALLHPVGERDLRGVRQPPEVGLQREALLAVAIEGLVERHRVHGDELRPMTPGEREREVEGVPGRAREVDGGENASERVHVGVPFLESGGVQACTTCSP